MPINRGGKHQAFQHRQALLAASIAIALLTAFTGCGGGGNAGGSGENNSNPQTVTLTVTTTGTGSGQVTTSDGKIQCGAGSLKCSADYSPGTTLTLTEIPSNGASFGSWSGCVATGSQCGITVTSSTTVSASFTASAITYSLTITEGGAGSGSVTTSDGKINCSHGSGTCTASYSGGSSVTLNATSASGSSFGGFSGACTGTASPCSIVMNSSQNVAATFNVATGPYTITIQTAGTGQGLVQSTDGALDCGYSNPSTPQTLCTASYSSGSSITLTQISLSGSTFAGWSGSSCSGIGVCVLEITGNTSITATFNTSASTTSNMTWQMSVDSSCSVAAYWRLFDKTANLVWPNASQVWVMNQTGTTYQEVISCTTGDTIAFGASQNSSSDTYFWGVGIDGTESCTSCAYKCSSTTVAINLVCQ